MNRYAMVLALGLLASGPALAYIQTPPRTVKELCDSSNYILTVRVEKVHAEKNILLCRKVRDLKGKYLGDVVKLVNGVQDSRVPEGCERLDRSTLMPGDRQAVFRLGAVGATAVLFVCRYDSVQFNLAHLHLDDQWFGYCSAAGDARWEWYNLLLCESHLRKAFFGTSERLAACVEQVLAGRDPPVTCLKDESVVDIHKQPLALRLGLTGVHRRRASGKPAAEGDPAVAATLVRELGSPDGRVRLKAATELNEFLGLELKDAVPALATAIRDKDVTVRRAAVAALRMAGVDKRALPPLVEAVGDPDPEVRRRAVGALGGLGPAAKDGVPPLIDLLKRPDRAVVASAVEALAMIDADSHRTAAVLAALVKAADAGGKYQTLYVQIKVPEDLARFGYVHDIGLTEPTSPYENLARAQGYKRSLPRAYWVYVYPYWFLWEGPATGK